MVFIIILLCYVFVLAVGVSRGHIYSVRDCYEDVDSSFESDKKNKLNERVQVNKVGVGLGRKFFD